MSRQWNQNRRRSAGDPPLAEPSSRPSHLIPLDILQQSFVQNSSAASSNLSSSQSPSATPPSSAEQLPQQENWPCVANSNATRPASPAPQPSQPPQPPPSTDPHTVAADADTPSHSAEHGGNGNQATQAPHQQDSSDAWGISLRGMGRWASARGWFQSTLGITSLVVTMVSLFLYGIRSYQMARWSERNDLMQMCASLIQANVNGGPDCERVLSEGPTLPPYSKRAVLYNAGVRAYKLTKRATSAIQKPPQVDLGFGLLGLGALAAFLAFVVVRGILAVLRSRSIMKAEIPMTESRSDEELVFTSPVRSEGAVKVTRDLPEGSETVEHEGPVQITKRKPPENHGPGEVRRRIIQDGIRQEDDVFGIDGGFLGVPNFNSSDDTLVAVWNESNSRKVSIATSSNEKPHDGLIEPKPTGSTKNSLDPDTGASYHSAPWKSTHSDDGDGELSLETKHKVEGTVKRAIVKMSIGGVALANGKAIEDQVGDALEKKERIPQHTGDCLAGEVTNDAS